MTHVVRRSTIQAGWLAGFVLLLGCDPGGSAPPANSPVTESQRAADESKQTFWYAINLALNNEFDAGESLSEAIRRLNQWVRHQEPPADWTLDVLVSGLPQPLLEISAMRELDELKFQDFDRLHLQETVWLRDASQLARGNQLDAVARATQLFDWVVRNVQLEPPASPGQDLALTAEQRLPRIPWETLLYGRGESVDRAWLFVLMARQQRLDVVLLGIGDAGASSGLRTWLPALLDRGELYLFEPTLGMPIPGPGGQGVATLAQVRADDKLLRQLDVDVEHIYPVTSEDLRDVVALIEASPGYLARRMRLVHANLAGEQAFVLSASPGKLADALRGVAGVADVQLWVFPQQTYWRLESRVSVGPEWFVRARRDVLPFNAPLLPPDPSTFRVASLAMQRGRQLHLKGKSDGQEGAAGFYQQARMPDSEIDVPTLSVEQKQLLRDVKENASYWMGLICYDKGRYEAAADYFAQRVLEPFPDGAWAAGARYNLARSLEADGRVTEALPHYRVDSTAPEWHGNQLRIRRLEGQAPSTPASSRP